MEKIIGVLLVLAAAATLYYSFFNEARIYVG